MLGRALFFLPVALAAVLPSSKYVTRSYDNDNAPELSARDSTLQWADEIYLTARDVDSSELQFLEQRGIEESSLYNALKSRDLLERTFVPISSGSGATILTKRAKTKSTSSSPVASLEKNLVSKVATTLKSNAAKAETPKSSTPKASTPKPQAAKAQTSQPKVTKQQNAQANNAQKPKAQTNNSQKLKAQKNKPQKQQAQNNAQRQKSQPTSSKKQRAQPNSSKKQRAQPNTSKKANAQPNNSRKANAQPNRAKKQNAQPNRVKKQNAQPNTSRKQNTKSTTRNQATSESLVSQARNSQSNGQRKKATKSSLTTAQRPKFVSKIPVSKSPDAKNTTPKSNGKSNTGNVGNVGEVCLLKRSLSGRLYKRCPSGDDRKRKSSDASDKGKKDMTPPADPSAKKKGPVSENDKKENPEGLKHATAHSGGVGGVDPNDPSRYIVNQDGREPRANVDAAQTKGALQGAGIDKMETHGQGTASEKAALLKNLKSLPNASNAIKESNAERAKLGKEPIFPNRQMANIEDPPRLAGSDHNLKSQSGAQTRTIATGPNDSSGRSGTLEQHGQSKIGKTIDGTQITTLGIGAQNVGNDRASREMVDRTREAVQQGNERPIVLGESYGGQGTYSDQESSSSGEDKPSKSKKKKKNAKRDLALQILARELPIKSKRELMKRHLVREMQRTSLLGRAAPLVSVY